jgi:hypothetical protein
VIGRIGDKMQCRVEGQERYEVGWGEEGGD